MLRSDEDSALPQGQEELYLLYLGRGAGLVPRGPPAALPPFSHFQWPAVSRVTSAALMIRGSEEPVLVWRQSVTASPLLVIPPRPRAPSLSPGGRQRSLGATAGAGDSGGVSQAFFGISHVSQVGPLPLLLLHLYRPPWGLPCRFLALLSRERGLYPSVKTPHFPGGSEVGVGVVWGVGWEAAKIVLGPFQARVLL